MDAERELWSSVCVTATASQSGLSENNFISPVASRSATQHTLDSALGDQPDLQPAGREIINFNKLTTLTGLGSIAILDSRTETVNNIFTNFQTELTNLSKRTVGRGDRQRDRSEFGPQSSDRERESAFTRMTMFGNIQHNPALKAESLDPRTWMQQPLPPMDNG